MKQKTRHLQSFLLLLLMTVMSTANAWATDPMVTYTYESDAAKATLSSNDYFSAASNPTNSGNCTFESNNLTCIVNAGKTSTVTFTFTAKTSFELASFTIRSMVNTGDMQAASIDYYKGSDTPTNEEVSLPKNSLDNTVITPSSPISLSNGDIFTIKVNLDNKNSSNKLWRINTITLTPSAGSTPTLSSIEVKTAPTKTTYTEGEYFAPADLVITKTMSDSSTEDVDYNTHAGDFTFSPTTSTALTTSNTTVTITYGGKSTTQAITVSAAAPTYSVTYHSNLDGASGTVTDGSTYAAGASVITQANSFSKSGYTFLGWSTSSGYQSSYTTAGNTVTMVAGGLDLYAQWQIDGSISSNPASGSSVVSGQAVTTTATSTAATGIKYNQGANEYTVAQLIASGGSVGSKTLNWTLSQNAIGAQIFSAVLTDGTFYSAVLKQNYTIGAAAPEISCSGNMVTITSDTNDASIYYTTNGDTPTNESALYSDPFAIGVTTTVKAIAIKSGSTSATTTQVCEYGAAVTTLPVTFDFNASPFTPGNITGADNNKCSMTQNNHEIYFRGTSASEFSIVDDDTNYLHMTQNGSNNHYIAIPISGINGRIDIKVWTTTTDSKFKIRGYLAQSTTTVSLTAPSKPAELAVNAHTKDTKLFEFRMKDISATNGVLYLGVNSSSFQNIEKITIETPAHMLEGPASVTMGDGETVTVSIKNHSAEYLPALGTVPSYVSAALNPSTGELVITPKAIGTDESITLALDTNGDGVADDVDLSIPVTVKGITSVSNLTSAVYEYGDAVTNLSVTAAKSSSLGNFTYTWYKNTVNSAVGGVVVKTESNTSSTTSTYTPSTTLAAEDASFYYCEVSVPGDTIQTKTSNVAYVLTSSTQRYFQMSNVAGNRQTSEASEAITGEIVAGGSATAIHTSGESFYRYIQRPSDKPHMYVVGQENDYITVTLGKNIADGDKLSVRLMGYLGTAAGLIISDGTHSINIFQTDETEKDYTNIDISAFAGNSTLYIKGKYDGFANYFTNLVIYTPGDVKISDPTPAEQTVGKGMTPSAISVTASDGTGSFSYQWQYSSNYTNDGNDGNDTWNDVTTGTGYQSATFTPAAYSPEEETTTYYRCIVTDDGTSEPKKTATSGVASVTVEGVTRYYYKISTGTGEDATFDGNGIATFQLSKSNFNSQTSKGYWYINGNNNAVNDNCFDGDALYMKTDGRCLNTEFYVMGASSFTIKCSKVSAEKRTYLVTVDGVEERITESTTETKQFPLNPSGSHIKLSNVSNNVYPGLFTFYQTYTITPTITVKKDGIAVTEATQYTTEGDVDYEVDSDSPGAINAGDDPITSSDASVATVSYAGGILTVHPVGVGETTITIHQKANGGYGEGRTTLIVNIKKLEVNMAFSFNKVVLTASELVSTSGSIPTAKLPTLTVTRADGTTNTAPVNWQSDDANLISVAGGGTAAAPTYSLTYHSNAGQGGARIYAYVNETGDYGAAVAYFDVVVQNGTSNNLPKGETIDVQEQFVLANDNGQEVVTLTYGGYKYNSHEYKYIDFKDGTTKKDGTDSWTNAASFNKYYIDGYQYNSHNENDAYNENGYQLLGMSDDYNSGKCPDGMWYKITDDKPQGGKYGAYERIRPFALACKGGYLKFEPKKSGVLTAYILQNGVIGRSGDSDLIGSKPRLGYWFDEDGWVQTNVTAVAKQPISDGNGIDQHVAKGGKDAICENKNLSEQMDAKWTGDDAVIIPMLKRRYCNEAKTEFSDTQEDGYIDNPYYWGNDAHVIDNNKEIIPTRITPVPFHNGFMVPEQCYVKYTLPVIAGKSYYFYGMMTKIGYVGMNFVEDESVLTSGGNNIAHEENTLHLTSNDDMTTYTFNGNVLEKSTLFDEVTLPSNYKPNQWNTICLPFALSENQVEAAFGTGTQLAIYNGLEHSSAEHVYYVKYLRHVDQNILPGQPYLIYPTGTGVDQNDGLIGTVIGTAEGAPDNNKRITFNDVLIEKNKLKQAYASYGSNKDVDGGTGFIFTGTYQMIAMPQYSLFYSPKDGKLYRWTGTGTTPNFAAYHAYMHPNSSSVMQNGIEFSFSDDDITDLVDETGEGGQETGIVIVEEIGGGSNAKAQLKSNTKAYNLIGQEIDPRSAKGLVIVNGEKVMY